MKLTSEQVAEKLHITESMVYALKQQGRLMDVSESTAPSHKLRFDANAVREFAKTYKPKHNGVRGPRRSSGSLDGAAARPRDVGDTPVGRTETPALPHYAPAPTVPTHFAGLARLGVIEAKIDRTIGLLDAVLDYLTRAETQTPTDREPVRADVAG